MSSLRLSVSKLLKLCGKFLTRYCGICQPSIHDSIYYKSLAVSHLQGWYLEFGVYQGYTFQKAYHAAKTQVDDALRGGWKAGLGKGQTLDHQAEQVRKTWDSMKFIAFDSFEGIPKLTSKVDRVYAIFPEGSYSSGEEIFLANIEKGGVDLTKVKTVKGFFCDTLNEKTAKDLAIEKIAVIHIDSDLYESAKQALDFCTPFLRDGTVVIFDEWFQFHGNPFLGEQRAFREWQTQNPEWYVSDHATQGVWTKSFILSKKPAELA